LKGSQIPVITTKTGAQKIGLHTTPKLPKVKGPEMNLRDRLNDGLINEKYLASNYLTAINETIDDELHQILVTNHNRIFGFHKKLFDSMFSLGEYNADLAEQIQVDDAFQVFNGYVKQFPYQPNNPS
jgi:spore coat protein CotF